MTADSPRFVAHVDILGMSSLVDRDPDVAWGVLSNLAEVRDKIGKYDIEFLDTNERLSVAATITSVAFSDTIVFFTRGDSETELRCMIVLAVEVLHKAMYCGVPVRVGLSYGKFYFNLERSLYAGPALIEAYQFGESAQWIGITMGKSIAERAASLDMSSGNCKLVVPWAVPIKDGTRKCQVVNWPAAVAHDLTVVPPISIEQFYQAFESTFGAFSYLPSDVREKYEHTVEFMNEQLRHHRVA